MAENTGPSDDTLRRLKGMLPSMAMSVHEGKLHGRGRKIGKPQPRKTCPVCCKLFDFVSVEREKAEIKAEPCEECGKLLKEGWIAFTSGDKYAFCRSERMKD